MPDHRQEKKMIETTIIIKNKSGLHARAATRFVEIASRFTSNIALGNENQFVDGKNILSLMLLAASQGSELFLKIEGNDEKEAFAAVSTLIDAGFNEDS